LTIAWAPESAFTPTTTSGGVNDAWVTQFTVAAAIPPSGPAPGVKWVPRWTCHDAQVCRGSCQRKSANPAHFNTRVHTLLVIGVSAPTTGGDLTGYGVVNAVTGFESATTYQLLEACEPALPVFRDRTHLDRAAKARRRPSVCGRVEQWYPRHRLALSVDAARKPRFITSSRPGPCAAAKSRPAMNVK